MLKIIIFFMVAYSLMFAGLAEIKKGIFDCKVKNISILSMVEGGVKVLLVNNWFR